MRIRPKPAYSLNIPPDIEPYCRQSFITADKEYEVHAVGIYFYATALILFQIVDDLRYPAWLPHVLFEIVERTLPSDWLCNIFPPESGRPTVFVLGPEFIVKDGDSLDAMVLLEADPVDLFWKRIEAIEKAREEQRWLEELDKDPGENK
jgi:hypothetical protein